MLNEKLHGVLDVRALFMRKNISPALGFEPMTFRLASSCKENLPNRDLCSRIDYFAPIGSRSLNKTAPMAARACSFDCSVLASNSAIASYNLLLQNILRRMLILCYFHYYNLCLIVQMSSRTTKPRYSKVLLKDSSGLDLWLWFSTESKFPDA